MKTLSKLLSFLCRLEGSKIAYHIEHNREDAIMVTVAVPGQRWEIEFFDDGSVEVEKFISTAEMGDEKSRSRTVWKICRLIKLNGFWSWHFGKQIQLDHIRSLKTEAIGGVKKKPS